MEGLTTEEVIADNAADVADCLNKAIRKVKRASRLIESARATTKSVIHSITASLLFKQEAILRSHTHSTSALPLCAHPGNPPGYRLLPPQTAPDGQGRPQRLQI